MKAPEDCTSLDEIREAIDALDRSVIAALGQRRAYVLAAAPFKRSEAAVRAPARVEAVIAQRRAWAEEVSLAPDLIEQLYRLLITHFIQEELERWQEDTEETSDGSRQ